MTLPQYGHMARALALVNLPQKSKSASRTKFLPEMLIPHRPHHHLRPTLPTPLSLPHLKSATIKTRQKTASRTKKSLSQRVLTSSLRYARHPPPPLTAQPRLPRIRTAAPWPNCGCISWARYGASHRSPGGLPHGSLGAKAETPAMPAR
jgi:hypothetical protein